jgi:hypothetical protein
MGPHSLERQRLGVVPHLVTTKVPVQLEKAFTSQSASYAFQATVPVSYDNPFVGIGNGTLKASAEK